MTPRCKSCGSSRAKICRSSPILNISRPSVRLLNLYVAHRTHTPRPGGLSGRPIHHRCPARYQCPAHAGNTKTVRKEYRILPRHTATLPDRKSLCGANCAKGEEFKTPTTVPLCRRNLE